MSGVADVPVCAEHGCTLPLWHAGDHSTPQSALAAAIIDLCWRLTPYGTTPDGDIAAYIVSTGTAHRLIAAAQSAGIPAAFRTVGE